MVALLERRVRRVVAVGAQKFTLTLSPGAEPSIEIRDYRSQHGFTVTVRGLYNLLAVRAADALIAERRERRGRRRSR